MNKSVRFTLIALVCAGGLAACAKKQQVKPAPPPPPPPPTQTAPAPPPAPSGFTPADLNTNSCLRQRVVYFDFNKSIVKPEFQQIMECQAKYLQDQPGAHVRLQGNTDDRGSREYNLGLGARRAKAVEAALEANGASASQISTVSYGEERPVCRQQTQSCWAKNRRVNIVYTSEQ